VKSGDWVAASLESAGDVFKETAVCCRSAIEEAARAVTEALRRGDKVLLCGNGGSAADAQHFATEMTVKMKQVRSPMAAIALTTNSSLLTAQANDLGFDTVFSRQIESLGRGGDVLLAISTSGMSANILKAVATAKQMGITVIGLTGCGGGEVAPKSDIAITIPSRDVPRIQEAHIAVCHLICEYAETALYGKA